MDKVKLKKLAEDLKALAESVAVLCEEEPLLEKKMISLEQVRGVLADKSRAGHTEKVREIIRKYGADRLSLPEQTLLRRDAGRAPRQQIRFNGCFS